MEKKTWSAPEIETLDARETEALMTFGGGYILANDGKLPVES